MHDKSDQDIHRHSDSSVGESKVGYGNPPKATRFAKGQSGNPLGRPKRPIGTSIKEIFDGDQMGKNGKVVSKREAFVIAVVNEALRGNQKAFTKFMTLMNRSGLLRQEKSTRPTVIELPMRHVTKQEYEDHIRNMRGPIHPNNE